MPRLFSFLRPKRHDDQDRERLACALKAKYNSFRDLLDSNSELLRIVAEIQEKLQGDQVFGTTFVSSRATRSVFHATRMVESLNALSGGRHRALARAIEEIGRSIRALQERENGARGGALVLGYDEIDRDMVSLVGGKSANLGEIRKAGLPIPDGYAITTAAYEALARENDLYAAIGKLRMEYETEDPAALVELSEAVQRLFLEASIPAEVEEAILRAHAALAERSGGVAPLTAMRSSAIGEDSELSYAGQYLSILAVPAERVLESYRLILASLFTPRAISYRFHQGIADADVSMSVACLAMVEARSSGVAFSRHPLPDVADALLINAVWGLGPYAVDGVVPPDSYLFSREESPKLQQREIAEQSVRLTAQADGELREEPVEPELRAAPCLSAETADEIAAGVMALERHFGAPQDVEWAVDAAGALTYLQSRPLQLLAEGAEPDRASASLPAPGEKLLFEGGDISCPGVGAGPVAHVDPDGDLSLFPQGAVLVAAHSSPKLVLILPRAAAVITEVGSVTGHMASLTREYRTPTLLNCPGALRFLTPGELATVDATNRRVYQGRVEELLAARDARQSVMRGTPVYRQLQGLAELVTPLNLLDPNSPGFKAENCRTLHDVMRMVHELSYREMFKISDQASCEGNWSLALEAPIPLDLHVIDLGDGLAELPRRSRKVSVDQVVSAPFKALLRGMLHEDLQRREPRPVHLGGLFSVISQQMLNPPNQGERFGDRSYALVSDKYLNFSSRVGYHYSVVDAYCGGVLNENYVNFEFKGGAADDARRIRRVRAIADILREWGFTVESIADRVVARYQKYDARLIEERLDMLGRLLLFTRQMDMLMTDEASVGRVRECFLNGQYDYSPPPRSC